MKIFMNKSVSFQNNSSSADKFYFLPELLACFAIFRKKMSTHGTAQSKVKSIQLTNSSPSHTQLLKINQIMMYVNMKSLKANQH